MQKPLRYAARAVTLALLVSVATGQVPGGVPGISHAVAQDKGGEKDAFEAAKELGTADAWNAFLSHYPQGFHADLARAYLRKLEGGPAAAEPTPAAASPKDNVYPFAAGSWGGIVRAGPGQDNARVASLEEGEDVTLLEPPVSVPPNDFPWFKISFRGGKVGYMWGGILCSRDYERPGIFKLCTTSVKASEPRQAGGVRGAGDGRDRPKWCASAGIPAEKTICGNSRLSTLDDVLNVAYKRAKFDSPKAHAEIDMEHRHWTSRRNACGKDVGCLTKRYDEQIQFLESFFGN